MLIFPFCSQIVFFTFSASYFSSLSIFKTFVLKSLPSISAIRSFFRNSFCFVVVALLLEWAILSSYFLCFVIFLLLLLLNSEHLNLICGNSRNQILHLPRVSWTLLLLLFCLFDLCRMSLC